MSSNDPSRGFGQQDSSTTPRTPTSNSKVNAGVEALRAMRGDRHVGTIPVANDAPGMTDRPGKVGKENGRG
jgi:hypothetical protein